MKPHANCYGVIQTLSISLYEESVYLAVMPKKMPEKTDLEEWAVREFAEAYVDRTGISIVFLAPADPPCPDTKCSIDGRQLWVEVAHVYGNDSDAKVLLGRTGSSKSTYQERIEARVKPLNQRIIGPLNLLLHQKSSKSYSNAPVWLLIRSANPLWSEGEYLKHRHEIAVPKNHPFEQIWLLCGPKASYGIINLFMA